MKCHILVKKGYNMVVMPYMRTPLKILASLAILFSLINFKSALIATGGSMSTGAEERPARNYFGTVHTSEGATLHVEYMAIGSRVKTEGIMVYEKPSDSEQNPRDHRIDIDLALIDKIMVPEHQKPVRYHKVDYYEVVFQFKGDQNPQRRYLIESNNSFFCDEVDGFHNPVPNEFRFSAVKQVSIEGVRSAGLTDRSKAKVASPEHQERKRHYCTQASQTISELEKEAEQLSGEKKGTMTKLVDKMKNWVGGLCSG